MLNRFQIEPLKILPQCVFAPLRETKIHTPNQQRRLLLIIGANGAIATILGAYLIKFPQAKIYSVLTFIHQRRDFYVRLHRIIKSINSSEFICVYLRSSAFNNS
ncbi:MAG: hypothetical protein PT120_19940 [Aphanizomenon gracile PMC649.10]|nr:hypothetical protein [Aphanizomenon gracile PMC638.10]MDM3852415.1 hypothetical protein [Aphanizomenon gracile PMC627.10]MDM3857090.1 hypothetical protein [Aphanizomenon gracile PMC649.10]MDM3858625.1 hypothetical protein [Aphanizomenon gracile PMC644.10]